MEATFKPSDPVPSLMEELVDGLHLLHVCRARGVSDLDRLLEYIEYTIMQIEYHRLGYSVQLSLTDMAPDEFVVTECDEQVDVDLHSSVTGCGLLH